MAIDVTVLGASGTTVTIPFTSVTNAAAAQAALGGISNLITAGVLEQVNYTGGGTLPAISPPATEGGVLALSASSIPSVFGLSGNYTTAVAGGTAPQPIIVGFGAVNDQVFISAGGSTVGGVSTVAGPGGAEVGNLGTNTKVYFGGAGIQQFAELGLGAIGGGTNPTATVWVTTPLKGQATFDDSSGQTTINLDTVASTLTVAHPFGQTLILTNSGNGQTTINVTSATSGGVVDGDALSFRGTSTVATTVNAAGGANSLGVATGGVSMWALMKSGDVFINGNGSDVVVFPTGTGVSATLFGGSGTDIAVGSDGSLQGGTGGNNVLFGGFDAGATTLVGGGSGDVLWLQASGDLIKSGPGTEALVVTTGDTIQEGVANTVSGSGANAANVSNFVSGSDAISLANPASGNYSLIGNTTVSPTANEVAFTYVGANTQVNFGDGTTWTVFNTQLQTSDFKV
jgi:hypothetical protein